MRKTAPIIERHTNKHKILPDPLQTPRISRLEESGTIPEVFSAVVPTSKVKTEVKDPLDEPTDFEDIYQHIFSHSALLHPLYAETQNLKLRARILYRNLFDNNEEMTQCLQKYRNLCEAHERLQKSADKLILDRSHNFQAKRQSINSKCSRLSNLRSQLDVLEEAQRQRRNERKRLLEESRALTREVG